MNNFYITIIHRPEMREAEVAGITLVEAIIPQVGTRLTLCAAAERATGYYREGFAFSPMYTIGLKHTLQGQGELRTWLRVEKAK